MNETPEKEVNVTESDNISDGKTIPYIPNMHVDFYCEKQKLTFSLQEQKLQENLLMKIQTSHRKIQGNPSLLKTLFTLPKFIK